MSDELITVGTYRFEYQAELARTLLAQHGISSFLENANTVTYHWMISTALGYIKLQVPAADAQRATEVIANEPGLRGKTHTPAELDSALQAGAEECLACGAHLPLNQETCAACGWSFQDAANEE